MSNTADNDQQQDKLLFSEAVSGITPLVQDKIIPLSEKNPSIDIKTSKTKYTDEHNHINKTLFELSDDYDPFDDEQQRYDLNYHQVSISKRRFNDFKKGQFNTELMLDLHGYNKDQARNELATFIEHCQDQHFTKVAIMPGFGYGVLRKSLNLWLRQLPQVLAFAESPQRAGGKGVIRLLLARGNN
jgi:DNA-nicking Smr family endonuclease